MPTFCEMFRQFWTAADRSRASRTVEWYGQLMLVEGVGLLLFPHGIASLLRFAPVEAHAAVLLRVIGMLICGFGMLYAISGRMNAQGLVFAALIDRPFVAPVVGALWYLDALPSGLALLFAVQDSGSWLWTFLTWRAEMRKVTDSPPPAVTTSPI